MTNRLANECLGTFFLVLTILVAAVYDGAGAAAPLAIGLVLIALVYAGGHISKAQYNPAVTLAFWIRGGYLSARDMFAFMGVQLAGAGLAAFVADLCLRRGFLVVAFPLDPWPALVAEFLFTFLLVWVIMNVATARALEGNEFYGLAIGFTVAGGIYTVGGISLAVFNPAVAVALVIGGVLEVAQVWIPIVGSLAGAVAATWVFRLGLSTEEPSEHATEPSGSGDAGFDQAERIRRWLIERGSPRHVCEGGVERLVSKWERTGRNVSTGVVQGFDDYRNEVARRSILDAAERALGASVLDPWRGRIERADTLVRDGTAVTDRPLDRTAEASERRWWLWTRPRATDEREEWLWDRLRA